MLHSLWLRTSQNPECTPGQFRTDSFVLKAVAILHWNGEIISIKVDGSKSCVLPVVRMTFFLYSSCGVRGSHLFRLMIFCFWTKKFFVFLAYSKQFHLKCLCLVIFPVYTT